MTTDTGPGHPTPSSGRPSRGRWRTPIAATSIFIAGLAAGFAGGVIFPGNTAELDAAKSQVQSSRDELEGLASEFAAAEKRNATLTASLAAAEASAASANEQAEKTRKQLDARGARLDRRTKALKEREKAVAARETALETSPITPAESENRGASGADSDPDTKLDPSAGDDFDRAWAVDIATDIIEDIRTLDERMVDGLVVSSALWLLSDSYGRLLDAGFPPGVDRASYYARVTTLQSFAEQAGDTYDLNPSEATARYAVIRKETGVLFDVLNGALGTNFKLP